MGGLTGRIRMGIRAGLARITAREVVGVGISVREAVSKGRAFEF